MTIHKEGRNILFIALVVLVALIYLITQTISILWLQYSIIGAAMVLYLLVLQFFRHPKRNIDPKEDIVLCPADGKVVVIEETEEKEFLKKKVRQISVFMSPLNVHVNRYPVSGKVVFSKYHPGKFLVAWHPKSSEENERTTVVVDHEKAGPILHRQIAGAVARRIVNYAKEGDQATQGAECGFIKFGSRVDIFVPLDAEILVKPDQVVKGGITELARFK